MQEVNVLEVENAGSKCTALKRSVPQLTGRGVRGGEGDTCCFILTPILPGGGRSSQTNFSTCIENFTFLKNVKTKIFTFEYFPKIP